MTIAATENKHETPLIVPLEARPAVPEVGAIGTTGRCLGATAPRYSIPVPQDDAGG